MDAFYMVLLFCTGGVQGSTHLLFLNEEQSVAMTCHQSSPLWYVDRDLDFKLDSDVKCQKHEKIICDINSNTITLYKPENSGMYACGPSSNHESSCQKAKLLNSAFTECNCQSLDFFIVAVTDDDDDETSEGKTIILKEDAAAQPLTKVLGDNQKSSQHLKTTNYPSSTGSIAPFVHYRGCCTGSSYRCYCPCDEKEESQHKGFYIFKYAKRPASG
ncbi:hypothetical protein AOXY_G19546 [Acipenser oxyrinchus oxyrinchus]|uniref:Ig-like domain-containing protein n=1 Tax=Acipenser oxyrinchus oxyrinchus TaxID=40147 RepID=A0AAD8D412_ACIOX|nr:hypothetical protein AOXY_G19546 [Acipenser oxyrinchus oxyrinchus]